MARRASRSLHPAWVGIAIVLAAGIVGLLFFQYGQKSDPFRTIQSLNIPDYYDNANSLRGNIYKIEGTIQNSLYSSREKGRVITVEVETSQGNYESIPVLIPPELNHVEIQRGNRVHIKVSVEPDGILKVEQLDKV